MPPPAWQFGREIAPGEGGRHKALQWVLGRNCSITPRRLANVYLSLCLLAMCISLAFWWQGAHLVSAFAGTELLFVGVVLLVYARHAADREVLTLNGRALVVEQTCAGRIARAGFDAERLTVEPAAGQGSLVQLSCHGRTVRVGRFLRPEQRAGFAQELRRALRRARLQEHATGYELK
jgi:uncharacterized membrane protein